jgi:hypothetical protein
MVLLLYYFCGKIAYYFILGSGFRFFFHRGFGSLGDMSSFVRLGLCSRLKLPSDCLPGCSASKIVNIRLNGKKCAEKSHERKKLERIFPAVQNLLPGRPGNSLFLVVRDRRGARLPRKLIPFPRQAAPWHA